MKDKLNNLIKKKHQHLEELGNIPVCNFGLRFKDNINYADLLRNMVTDLTREELENELNELAQYVFNGTRKVYFHEFRQFPYIQHGEENSNDLAGNANNYMQSDYYYIRFIKLFLKCKHNRYSFLSAKYIIENTTKIDYKDHSILDMPIDVLIK